LFVYKTKATRPRPELQDQDQTCKTKTAAYRTTTSFCWSETGLVTRPRSQTTSLDFLFAFYSIWRCLVLFARYSDLLLENRELFIQKKQKKTRSINSLLLLGLLFSAPQG